MTIHITIHGQGKPLVLFHGWGFDSHIWHALLPALSARGDYQLYLVDLPGFGQSLYMDWDAFKVELLRQLPEKFAVIGWSMGGLYATRLAIEAPQRVTQVMNIASSPRFTQTANWPGVSNALLETFHTNLASNPEQALAHFIKLQMQGQDLSPSLSIQKPTLMALRAGLGVLADWDLRAALLTIKTPVCYLFGRLDTITPRKTMVTMQVDFPHFEYILFPNAAHVPFLSHPDHFIAELGAFLL